MKFKKKNDILPATPQVKPKKEKKQSVEYWNDLVKVWFDFIFEKFKDKPSFEGPAQAGLKGIIKTLKLRADSENLDWTKEVATQRLRSFLVIAFTDNWLKENFMLHIINSQKDKVFLILQKRRENGTHQQTPTRVHAGNAKSAGANKLASILREDIQNSGINRRGE